MLAWAWKKLCNIPKENCDSELHLFNPRKKRPKISYKCAKLTRQNITSLAMMTSPKAWKGQGGCNRQLQFLFSNGCTAGNKIQDGHSQIVIGRIQLRDIVGSYICMWMPEMGR